MQKKKKTEVKHRPTIETMINTAAIALTSYGVVQVTTGDSYGYIAILFAVLLEWFKYYCRSKDLW
jgi:hypothetical protein